MADLIDRQAALDTIMGQPPEPHYPAWYAAQIEGLPPVQPEPHEGHWIGGDGSYICSECNSSPMDFIETMGSSFDAYVETLMNFCPNCGAKMFWG